MKGSLHEYRYALRNYEAVIEVV